MLLCSLLCASNQNVATLYHSHLRAPLVPSVTYLVDRLDGLRHEISQIFARMPPSPFIFSSNLVLKK